MNLFRLLVATTATALLSACDRSDEHFDDFADSPLPPEPRFEDSDQPSSNVGPRPAEDPGSRAEFTNDHRSAPPAPKLPEQEGVRLVTPEQAAALAEPTRVPLDVRSAEEFAEGHLEGAQLLDFYSDDFLADLGQLDLGQPFLLYCRSGGRSNTARKRMQELGFKDVAEIKGGILAWEEAGNPVTTADAPAQ